MSSLRWILLGLAVASPLVAGAASPPTTRSPATRSIVRRALRVDAGPNINHFVQTDALTMHTVVRTNGSPRVLFATPAGNSGVGLWFRPVKGRGLAVEKEAAPVDHEGHAGVALTLSGPPELELDRVMLDSMRALRDKDHGDEAPRDALVQRALALFGSPAGRTAGATPEMIDRLSTWLHPRRVVDPARPGALILEREAFGSGARYRVEIVPHAGTRVEQRGETTLIRGEGATRFDVRTFIDRAPLQPLEHVLTPGAKDPKDARAQDRNLGLLVYKEKFLAGSYQYLTYFGRDTLISARLLGSRLTPEALGTAVGSVLDRVSAHGRVAHEESNGDQATLEALPKLMKGVQAGKLKLTPAVVARMERAVYDYKMMDGEFLLPSLTRDFVEHAKPAEIARTLSPVRLDALARVVARILDQTDKWADKRGASVSDLVHLRRGQIVGNWRDSGEGLGNGRTPLDVNAYLVPAALESIDKLLADPAFPREALIARVAKRRPGASAALAKLGERRDAWRTAAQRFDVSLDAGEARGRLRGYLDTYTPEERAAIGAAKLWSGVTVAEALAGKAAPELDGGVRFPGISLDQRGKPTPVFSSDEAFHLFYGEPAREELMQSVTRMLQPFPIGLVTPVGVVVANPAYSDRPGDHALFDRDHYHGAVVWSWPQTMLRRGLEKQLARYHGDAQVEGILGRALAQLDGIAKNVGAMKSAELWTWKVDHGAVVPVAFGASAKHTTEGAALQLWSNTY